MFFAQINKFFIHYSIYPLTKESLSWPYGYPIEVRSFVHHVNQHIDTIITLQVHIDKRQFQRTYTYI
jgi:hypothetical protein